MRCHHLIIVVMFNMQLMKMLWWLGDHLIFISKRMAWSKKKKNIFHIRCHISNKVYSMIIDSKSYANVASTELVRKLSLNIIKHERSYRLQWLNWCDEVWVTKKVLISFVVGKYKDEILCDVVPMHVTHLLLGILGNLIERPSMIGLRINIFLKRMERHSHFYYCHLNRFMKTNRG
jgi:hypothetical protein